MPFNILIFYNTNNIDFTIISYPWCPVVHSRSSTSFPSPTRLLFFLSLSLSLSLSPYLLPSSPTALDGEPLLEQATRASH